MSAAPRVYTAAEYLEFERASEGKHEFVNGHIYPMRGGSDTDRASGMSGGTDAHALIGWNVLAAFHAAFRGRACRAHTSDMRMKILDTGMYTYPDVSALCGRPELEDGRRDTLLNPSLVIEVLSPSTEDYDRGDKFAHYRRLASLREYVLVAQDRPHVERYVRAGDGWVLTEFDRLDDVVALPSVDATLVLRDVYERVEFTERPRPRMVREVAASGYAAV